MTSPRSIAAAEGRLVRVNLLLCCAAGVSVPAAALALLPSTQAVLIAIKNAATLATGNSQVRSDSAFVSGKPSSVPISSWLPAAGAGLRKAACQCGSSLRGRNRNRRRFRSEEHTSELQSQSNLVCRLLLEK